MNENFQERILFAIDALREEVSTLKSDVAWIKGKLAGRAEVRHIVLSDIALFVAICALVVAILK